MSSKYQLSKISKVPSFGLFNVRANHGICYRGININGFGFVFPNGIKNTNRKQRNRDRYRMKPVFDPHQAVLDVLPKVIDSEDEEDVRDEDISNIRANLLELIFNEAYMIFAQGPRVLDNESQLSLMRSDYVDKIKYGNNPQWLYGSKLEYNIIDEGFSTLSSRRGNIRYSSLLAKTWGFSTSLLKFGNAVNLKFEMNKDEELTSFYGTVEDCMKS